MEFKEVMYLDVAKPLSDKLKKCRNRPHQRQRLPCPVCQIERLIDAGLHTKSKTYKPTDFGYNDADYYQKCYHCKTEIGIKKFE